MHQISSSSSPIKPSIPRQHDKVDDILTWRNVSDHNSHSVLLREGHTTATSGQYMFVMGGVEGKSLVNLKVLLRYDVANGAWSAVKSCGVGDDDSNIPHARTLHASVNLTDSHVLLFGGEAYKSVTAAAAGAQSVQLQLPPTAISSKNNNNNISNSNSNSNSNSKLPSHLDSVASSSLVENAKWNGRQAPNPKHSLAVFSIDSASKAPTKYVREKRDLAQEALDLANNGGMGGALETLDDMYVLDTNSMVWCKIISNFSPSTRKGHSMTVVENINLGKCGSGGPQVVLFGGYSRESKKAMNSIHVCSVHDILSYAYHSTSEFSPDKYGNIGAKKKKDNNSGSSSSNNSKKRVTWRTIQCTGTSPSPRYWHSATRMHVKGVDYLAVFGGVGKNNRVLCDLYLLNLDTLVWDCAYKNDMEVDEGADPTAFTSINQLTPDSNDNGAIKPACLFAAASFATDSGKKFTDLNRNSKENLDTFIIFGGASNVADPSDSCHKSLLAFDIIKKEWTKAVTGPNFPSHRYGHSFAVVEGISLVDESPVTQRPTKAYSELFSRSPHGRVVVSFGGSCQFKSNTAEVWVLDPDYRDSRAPFNLGLTKIVNANINSDSTLLLTEYLAISRGVSAIDLKNSVQEGYNNNSNDNSNNSSNNNSNKNRYLGETFIRTHSEKSFNVSKSFLRSVSATLLPPSSSSSSSSKGNINSKSGGMLIGTSKPDANYEKMVLKVRQDRSRSELALQMEREKVEDQNELIAELNEQIKYMVDNAPVKRLSKNQLLTAINDLRAEIERSKAREQDLKEENNQLCDLLEREGFS